MGNFTKFFLQFDANFWSGRGQQWLVANHDDDSNYEYGGPARDPMEFHDIDALVPGSNTLFTYVTGADCDVWSTMTDEERRTH